MVTLKLGSQMAKSSQYLEHCSESEMADRSNLGTITHYICIVRKN